MADAPEVAWFLQAVELPAAEREALLRGIVDAQPQRRVRSLLHAHDELGDEDPFAPALQRHAERVLSPLVGSVVDGFRIVREIGRGGMGVVYEAEQLEPRRRVALKTLPFTSVGDERSVRRLAREADALARLSHVGIAQVYGFGHAQAFDGVPYLVMELVEGVPIDEHCARAGLDVDARLALLAAVCDAVAHAHAQGVVHRDLKPQNVLVTGDGRVKVLDFGIARVLDDGARSLCTRTGQVLGTLTYLAPEQLSATGGADGAQDAPAPRVDVYSLGVVAYELLTGRPPLDLPDAPLAGILRFLADAEPAPLGRFAPQLRGGDVELVVGKALAREPERRYADASALLRDLERVRADEPVAARAPSAVYQARKFVRRHRVACAGLLAVLLSLGAGLGWALHERSLAKAAQLDAEAMATHERARSRANARTVDVLRTLVMTTVPQHHGGEPPTMDAAVDRLAAEIDELHPDEPYVLGQTHLLLVHAMAARGDLERAEFHLERARQHLVGDTLDGPRSHAMLAWSAAVVAARRSRSDEALEHLEVAWRAQREVGDPVLRRRIAGALATELLGVRRDLERAESLVRDELRTLDEGSAAWQDLQATLARALVAQDRGEAAIEQCERVIACERARQPGSLALATALQNLGLYLQERGDHERAFPLLRESLDIRRSVLRDDPHTDLALGIDNFAIVLRGRGEAEQALALFDEAEAMFRELLEPPHRHLAVCLTEAAVTLRDLGRADEAERRLLEALEMFEQLGGEPTPQHAAALEHYATLDGSDEQRRARLACAERAVAMREQIHGADDVLVARALEVLARAQFAADDLPASERTARRCLDLRLDHYGEDDWRTWTTAFCIWVPMARRGEFDAATAMIARAIDGTLASTGAERATWACVYLEHLAQVCEGREDERGAAAARARIDELRR